MANIIFYQYLYNFREGREKETIFDIPFNILRSQIIVQNSLTA